MQRQPACLPLWPKRLTYCLAFLALSLLSTSASVVTYPAPQGEGALPASRICRVWASKQPVGVYAVRVLKPHTWAGDNGVQEFELAAMAYFDFSERVDVEIEWSTPVETLAIRPLRLGIQPEIDGKWIRFTLRQPCNLSIEVNEDITRNLQLFANPIEASIADPDDPDVRFFGPGIHFPEDDGIPGAIKLRSAQTVCIAGGAIVHGSIQTPFHESVRDVRIHGRGILLGERIPAQSLFLELSL